MVKTKYYDREIVETEGKNRMYRAVEDLIMEYKSGDSLLRFMSLPGKDWRFETRLDQVFDNTLFTGFERDDKMLWDSRQNIPGFADVGGGWGQLDYSDMCYYATDHARWFEGDVNVALMWGPEDFYDGATQWRKWIENYCMWNAVWLDYCGPATDKMANALSNLHYHCDSTIDEIPVAVTVLKGREIRRNSESMIGMTVLKANGSEVLDRQAWLEYHLGGGSTPGVKFKTLDYFEYQDSHAPMCNILGVIQR